MLNIEVNKNGTMITYELKGSLDVNSAPAFKEKLGEMPADVKDIVFDMSALRYVSSAGLRVILAFVNQTDESGQNLSLKNVNGMIMEVFEDTGFADILTIEND